MLNIKFKSIIEHNDAIVLGDVYQSIAAEICHRIRYEVLRSDWQVKNARPIKVVSETESTAM